LPDCPSFDQCVGECDQNDGCFQALYDGQDCVLGTRNFRLGVERKPDQDKKWQSKWNKKRIHDWATAHIACSNMSFAFKDAFVCG
jgi:hypothetical protein